MLIELRPPTELKPYPNNPRSNDGAVDAVARSIQEFGFQSPIVVDANYEIICGHTRWKAATKLGLAEVPVHVAKDLSPDQVKAFRIADNKTGEIAEWNFELLKIEIAGLQGAAFDIAPLAFDADELAKIMGTEVVAGNCDPDDVPQVPVEPITRPGDLWVLGEHFLICGDCSDATTVDAVLDGSLIDMAFTDPPYGHNNNNGDLINRWEAALGKQTTKSSAARPIANDGPEANALVRQMFALVAERLKPGCCLCCCCSGGGGPDPQFARWSLWLDEVIPFKMCVVWDKGGLGMGWHYRRNWECILIAEQPGAACRWFGGNDTPNVIRDIGKIIPSAAQHPTEKPVALAEFFLKLHSERGDLVFEPFAGSGSTLIACEQLGRQCRAIELSPAYCDMIVARWEKFTGRKAEHLPALATAEAATTEPAIENTPVEPGVVS